MTRKEWVYSLLTFSSIIFLGAVTSYTLIQIQKIKTEAINIHEEKSLERAKHWSEYGPSRVFENLQPQKVPPGTGID